MRVNTSSKIQYMERYRQAVARVQQKESKPKIRSMVSLDDFKDRKPRVIEKQVPPAIPAGNQMKAFVKKNKKITAIRPKPSMPRQPNEIPLEKPYKPPMKTYRQLKKAKEQNEKALKRQPPAPPQPKKEESKNKPPAKRSLLQQQLLQVKKSTRMRAESLQKKRKTIRSQTVVRTGKTISPKQISQLKNMGVNRILVMIAAGPSVLEVDFEPIKNHPVIDFMCINKPYIPVWPSRFWAFCDHSQYRANQGKWDNYGGIIINSPNVKVRKPNQVVVKTRSGKGFSKNLSHGYHIGRSSTYANLQVAYYMAYKKVFIFGCDMSAVGDKLHHYGQNPDVKNEVRKSRFPNEAKHFLHGAQTLTKEERNRFVFCSSYNNWEFTKYFKKLDHKQAVQEIQDYVKDWK